MANKYRGWEGSPAYRWQKMYRGIKIKATCDELNAPRTAEGSWRAWKAYVAKQILAIDGSTVEDSDKVAHRQTLEERLTLAPANEHEAIKLQLKSLASTPADEVQLDDAQIQNSLETLRLLGINIPIDADPQVLQILFGQKRIFDERKRVKGKVEEDRTMEKAIERFKLEIRETMKPRSFKDIDEFLKKLIADGVIGKDTAVDLIDEYTIVSVFDWLKKQNYATAEAHNKRLQIFRRFVRWAYEVALLPSLPRNLNSKLHRAKVKHKQVKQYTGVKEAIAKLKLPYKLWALLCLNTGMTNADLGALSWDMISGDKLVRRRVKTGDNPNAPTVEYKLWDETIATLKEYGWGKTGLVFKTESGGAMWHSRFDEEKDKVVCTDNFHTHWKRNSGCQIPLAKFRSIAATALKTDLLYRSFVDLFLGHTPKSVAEKFYSAEDWKQFGKAVDHIRKTLLG